AEAGFVSSSYLLLLGQLVKQIHEIGSVELGNPDGVIPAKAGIQNVAAVKGGTGFRLALLSFQRKRELAGMTENRDDRKRLSRKLTVLAGRARREPTH
ncbi:MAG: hypothetical protein L0387_33015, partial [Acidobacteria bacterium]|nr:hypothetical protein [Acidobacteriota bacterium]